MDHFSEKYLSIPYANTADNNPDSLDCWELVRKVSLDEFGTELPLLTYPSSDDCYTISSLVMDTQPKFVRQCKPMPGDVMLIKFKGLPIHVGIMIDEFRFMHTLKSVGVSIEYINSIKWKSRVEGFYRWQN